MKTPPSFLRSCASRVCLDPRFIFGVSVLVFMVVFSVSVYTLSPYKYDQISLTTRNMSPCAKFWLGTDELGRDLLTRLALGTLVSLFIGFTAAVIDLVVGTVYGVVAGYVGRQTEEIMMRVLDALTCLPYILFVILFNVIFPRDLCVTILSICFLKWANMARILCKQVRQLKNQDFISSAVTLGASPLHIMRFHLLPHLFGTMITVTTLTIPSAIYTESFISLMGLGVQPPLPSWGSLLHEGINSMYFFPHKLLFTSTTCLLSLLSFHLIGQSMRDGFDPQVADVAC